MVSNELCCNTHPPGEAHCPSGWGGGGGGQLLKAHYLSFGTVLTKQCMVMTVKVLNSHQQRLLEITCHVPLGSQNRSSTSTVPVYWGGGGGGGGGGAVVPCPLLSLPCPSCRLKGNCQCSLVSLARPFT